MAHYIASDPQVMVRGNTIASVVVAMDAYSGIAHRILARHGLRRVVPGHWYPMQSLLDVYKAVGEEVGEHTLLAVGKQVPQCAKWPQNISNIEEAMASIDVAYHMNHSIEGKLLFDSRTGAMQEGIGHYRCTRMGKRQIVMVCDTPYPSEIDRGIMLGIARVWKPLAQVVLDETQPSRKQGANACTYLVKW